MSQITHIEIHGEDPEGLAEFYRSVLGWRITKLEGLAYWRIEATPGEAAWTGGGLTHLPASGGGGWLPFVKVEAIDEVLSAARARGAELVKPKSAVPRTAWIAILKDPAGNRFAVWQADAAAFPAPELE